VTGTSFLWTYILIEEMMRQYRINSVHSSFDK